MGITFVFILPLGVVWMRFYGKVRAHYINNALGFVSFLIGLGLAFKISSAYGYGDYRAAHQIIGLIILGLFVVQISLGVTHHAMYKKHQKKTTMGLVHRFLGPILLLLGLINGIL
jgi:phosphoglycerol transferase MdoB-like AlkP superfamily enzyme